jgi:phosphoglycolate phosphatase
MRDSSSRRFRLLVFDWDGTLADSTTRIGEALQNACRDIGLPVPSDVAARHVIGLGLADALRTVAPTLTPERYPELSARYRHHYLTQEEDIPLFAGTRELLGELDAAGYLLAVATGKSRDSLDRVLARNGLVDAFHATRCADEGRPKPDPEMLLHVMDRLAAKPRETLMIGDTTHDLLLARNAGAAALAVAYGAHDAQGLAALAPEAIVHSTIELHQWLTRNG